MNNLILLNKNNTTLHFMNIHLCVNMDNSFSLIGIQQVEPSFFKIHMS